MKAVLYQGPRQIGPALPRDLIVDGRAMPSFLVSHRHTLDDAPMRYALPLGFIVFSIGIFVLSAFDLGWIPPKEHADVALVMIAFVAPLELIAAVIGFLSRDTAGATGLAVFSGVWVTLGIGLSSSAAPTMTASFFLFGMSVFVLVLALASFSGKPLFGVLLLVATARFVLMGVYEATGSSSLLRIGGIVGLAVVAAGIYGAVALLLEDVKQRTVLPLGRRGAAAQWLTDELEEHIGSVGQEAGVRRHL